MATGAPGTGCETQICKKSKTTCKMMLMEKTDLIGNISELLLMTN
jgi:hypothetical protein